MSTKRITVKAPAKINLFLEVLKKRPDGYHGIRSVIVPVSLYDTIELEVGGKVSSVTMDISRMPLLDPKMMPDPSGNVATKAALAFKKATGCRGGVRIHIVKRTPICGGMGGGSADAAAVLRGLNRLCGANLSVEELAEIGGTLGSDIPAMVFCGPVIAEGRGEKVRRIECMPAAGKNGSLWALVVNPGFGVSTSDIYTRYSTVLTSSPGQFKTMVSSVEKWDREAICGNLFNSLDKTVFVKYPLISIIVERLREAKSSGVLLSGSGASIFAFAESREHADSIGRIVGRTMGSWLWRKVVRVLPDGVMVAHSPLEARV